MLLAFTLYAWALVGLFEENEWTTGWRNGETVTVMETYICMQAFIFAFIFAPVVVTQAGYVAVAKRDAADLNRVIDREPLVRTPASKGALAVASISFNRGFRFEDVTFKYPNAPEHALEVFSNASFKIESGCTTAIVGGPFSGKSTILSLLTRLYDPCAGQILCGSFNSLKDLDLDVYRQQVALLDSEPAILQGSIVNNIKLGKRSATDDEIVNAIKLANAEFVFMLKHGVNTLIGYNDRGVQLSLSQKHRIAIARALVADPKLILIDELTEKLDRQS